MANNEMHQKFNKSHDLSIARALTWRYVIALALVASLSTAAWFSLHLVISEQNSTAAVVNVSGRQRMLSQRTALFSNLLITSPQAERPVIRDKLKEAIELMARSHRGLINGDREMGLPATMSPAVRAMYFDGSNPLDAQVAIYTQTVQDLLLEDDSKLTADNPLLQYITRTAPTSLVAALDQMVSQYQVEGEASVRSLAKAETIFWLVTLLLLTLEAALIFHPFIKHVRSVIAKLHRVTDELQSHQEHLDKMIRQRTAQLENRSKELADSEEKFRLISTAANDAIAIIGTEEQVIYWNPAAEKIFGYMADEIIGQNLHNVLTPTSQRDTAHHGFSSFQQTGEGYFIGKTLELTALRKGGEEFPIELSISAIRMQNSWHALGIIRDITERKQTEAQLVESESRLRTIIENEPECIKIMDTHGHLTEMNPAGLKMIEADSLEQVTGLPIFNVIAPEYRSAYAELHKRVLTGESMQMQYEVVGLKGGRRWLETHAVPMQDHGEMVHLAVSRDITDRKRAEGKLQLAASVFTHSREGITITTADGTIIDVNDAFTRITGYTRDEVLGKNPRILSSGRQDKAFYVAMWHDLLRQGHWYGEVWNRRKDGEVYAEMLTISAVRDAENITRQYVALFSDITPFKEHQNQLEHIAHYDALTTLPNRVLLADRLHQAMAQAQRHGQRLAVTYLDLDGFKAINDNYGHDAGDQLLMTVSTRMKQALREGDTLARLGGDEFVAVLLDLADIEASVPMLTRLLAAAAQPVHVNDMVLQVSASLGVTFYPQTEDLDADQLLRQADQAMYQAKLSGKNRYHVFDAEQDRSVRGHHESLDHIRHALTANEFVLYYQPKVNMRTGAIIGAEALIRWQHPERGLLPPAAFLPVIEDHPLAVEVGEWVVATALTQLATWRAAGLDIPVSVNVGARQLQQVDFVERLREILAMHPDIRPGDLELEVLETSALEDLARVSRVIEECREIGVMFALDDFGTGYSSLTYLKRLPVTLLKIDQTFVRDMLDDPDDLAILDGVISLATAFRREVIAEGVETHEHGEMLLRLGCELAQGYGIARPMEAHRLPLWATEWQIDPAWANLPAVSRDDLPLLFASVEHRAWISAVENHLREEREVPPPLDHHQCRFGEWMEGEGQARHGTQPAFKTIELLHRQVHVLAVELLELQALNRTPEALARLRELHGLRDALLVQLKTLVKESRR